MSCRIVSVITGQVTVTLIFLNIVAEVDVACGDDDATIGDRREVRNTTLLNTPPTSTVSYCE